MLVIKPLSKVPEYIERVAKIYVDEWLDHYSREWNIHTIDEMVQDLVENYLDQTYVGYFEGDGDGGSVFVGTVALLDEDLKSHSHLSPWMTCLYVEPEYRGRGYGRKLAEYVMTCGSRGKVFLWCDSDAKKRLYQHWGFSVLEEISNSGYGDDGVIYVMQRF